MDNDFIKKAYETGRVCVLSSAFDEYPVEEEWHKGNKDNFTNDSETKYYLYNIDDKI